MQDPTALQIFVWILITVDRKTGSKRTGRFAASDELGMAPRTFHKALTERLAERYDLVTLTSDNKGTLISLKNWDEYQHNGDTKVTTKGQQSDTKVTQYKNIRSKDISNNTNRFGNQLVNHAIKEFENVYGFYPTDKSPRRSAWNLVQKVEALYKDIGEEPSDERIKQGITSTFKWISKQDWGGMIQNMSTVMRKFNMFSAFIKKKKGVS